ncbi:MAG: DUF2236 domain-containing protein, partial [Archangium sp.]|nr:DUF2236 domain-containing protein [Archangium sp.]
GDGFAAALRVRLIHARVRHGLRRSSAWRHDDWGVPINQYDMAGTLLLFSSIVVDGLQQLGVTMTRDEEDDVMHLWRVVGWVMGVDAELTCTSLGEARELWRLLDATQADPDDDSRRLANALIGSQAQGSIGAWQGFLFAMSRHLIGERYANALGFPKGRAWKLAPLMVRQVVKNIEATAKRVPGARATALRAGMTYWRRAVEGSRGDVSFPLPTDVKAERRD